MKKKIFFTIIMAIVLLASCKKNETKSLEDAKVPFSITIVDTVDTVSIVDVNRQCSGWNIHYIFSVYYGDFLNQFLFDQPKSLTFMDENIEKESITPHSITFTTTLSKSYINCRYSVIFYASYILESGVNGKIIPRELTFTPPFYPTESEVQIVNGPNTKIVYMVLPPGLVERMRNREK